MQEASYLRVHKPLKPDLEGGQAEGRALDIPGNYKVVPRTNQWRPRRRDGVYVCARARGEREGERACALTAAARVGWFDGRLAEIGAKLAEIEEALERVDDAEAKMR